jgi:hypothetical protein
MTAPAASGSYPDRPVIDLEHGITVYPARRPGGRWRAVWYEDGVRDQCESVSEEKLAAKLETSLSGWRPMRRICGGRALT